MQNVFGVKRLKMGFLDIFVFLTSKSTFKFKHNWIV